MRRASQAPILPTVTSATHQQQQQQHLFNSSASSGGSHSTASGASPSTAAYTLTPSLLETTPPKLSLPTTAAAAAAAAATQLNSSGGSSAGSGSTSTAPAATAAAATGALPRAVLPTNRGPPRGAHPPGAGRGLDTEDGDPMGGGASPGEFEVKDNLLVRDAFVCTMAELLGGIGGFVRRSEVSTPAAFTFLVYDKHQLQGLCACDTSCILCWACLVVELCLHWFKALSQHVLA
jgi:hypothetical protein